MYLEIGKTNLNQSLQVAIAVTEDTQSISKLTPTKYPIYYGALAYAYLLRTQSVNRVNYNLLMQ